MSSDPSEEVPHILVTDPASVGVGDGDWITWTVVGAIEGMATTAVEAPIVVKYLSVWLGEVLIWGMGT